MGKYPQVRANNNRKEKTKKEITFLRVAMIQDAIQEATGHFNKNITISDFLL